MYIKVVGQAKCGEKIAVLHKFLPEFMVRNKLSPKPQKAANKLKEMVEGPNSIVKDNDVSIRQDYDNDTVILNLLSQCYHGGPGGWAKGTDQGQSIIRSTVLPATATVDRYTNALKKMVGKPFSPEFMIRNKLSAKPKKAAEKLKEMVEGRKSIVKNGDVSIRQDYSNGTVTLNLLSKHYIVAEPGSSWAKGTDQGQSIVHSTVLPTTAAVKRYTKALKDMVEKPFEENPVQTVISKPKKKWYQFWK